MILYMTTPFRTPIEFLPLVVSQIATYYANWRVQPLKDEMVSYNQTDKILLSFDDFADDDRIQSMLNILEKEKIKAAFFLIGDMAYNNPEIVAKIAKAGHWIGNHTKNHRNLLSLKDKDVEYEINNGPHSTLLRPPFGKFNKRIRKIAASLGYKICYWTIDSDDWKGISKDEIILRVTERIHKGACVLLHLNGQNTLEALPDLIKEIKNKGLAFCDDRKDLAI